MQVIPEQPRRRSSLLLLPIRHLHTVALVTDERCLRLFVEDVCHLSSQLSSRGLPLPLIVLHVLLLVFEDVNGVKGV